MMNIQLTKEALEGLAAVAALNNVEPEQLAAQMLEEQIQRLAVFEQEKREDLETLKQMKNDDYVTHEDMTEWLDNLKTGKN